MQSLCPLGATYCDACERLFKQLWICLPGIARRMSPVMICSATDGFVEGAQSHFTFQALHRQRACGLPSFKQVPCVMAEVIPAKMMYLLFLRPSGSVATSAVSLAGGTTEVVQTCYQVEHLHFYVELFPQHLSLPLHGPRLLLFVLIACPM